MNESESNMNRRDFLKTGIGVTAGAAVLGAAQVHAAPDGKKISLDGNIPTRRYGKTGHELPILGYGGAAIVDHWEELYSVKLKNYEERAKMIRYSYDKGVRFFDTARVYAESEGIMGNGLKGIRDDVYLASKVAVSDPGQVRASVEKSLSELQTDYVDCMQVHSPAIEAVGAAGGMKIYEELEKLRSEGMIRFIGLTTHIAFEDVFKMLDTGNFDQVLLARGYLLRGYENTMSPQNIGWREKCVARAHELDMAIIAMKVMGANLMGRGSATYVADYKKSEREKLPAAAVRWVLDDDRISMLNIGMSIVQDVDDNLSILNGDLKLTDADQGLLADYSRVAYISDYFKTLRMV